MKVAPRAGFEPATDRLTVDCSTTELPGNLYRRATRAIAPCALNKGMPRSASTNRAQKDTILPKRMPKPKTKLGRTILGTVLVVGGVFGFLPILGFWMIPLGLVILSQDFASVRRLRRKWEIRLSRWWREFRAR